MWLTKAHTSQEAPTSISGSSSPDPPSQATEGAVGGLMGAVAVPVMVVLAIPALVVLPFLIPFMKIGNTHSNIKRVIHKKSIRKSHCSSKLHWLFYDLGV